MGSIKLNFLPAHSFAENNGEREAEPFLHLTAGVSIVSGSASGLGSVGGPEGERAGPGGTSRAVAEDDPGLSIHGHASEGRECECGPTSRDAGAQKLLCCSLSES